MNTKSFLSILALIVVLLAGVGFIYFKQDGVIEVHALAVDQSNTTAVSVNAQQLAIATTQTANTSSYKDGIYTATADYAVPEGKIESVSVTLTLKGGVVVDSTVNASPRDHDSRRFDNQFIAGYKAYVTGKSIDDIRLGTVSGSSLTSQGFNAALASIKAQAQV